VDLVVAAGKREYGEQSGLSRVVKHTASGRTLLKLRIEWRSCDASQKNIVIVNIRLWWLRLA
jgi:hypothetical protein